MTKKDFLTAQPGFTLLELVISIAIVAVMTALLGYYWSFSTEKAKAAEIEKTVRTLKDSIDTKTLDDHVAVKSTSNYILGRRVYELVDTDQHKKTNHFVKNPLHDVSIIFACGAPETDCGDFKLDNAKFQGALIVYAIGKQTNCNLDETANQSTTEVTSDGLSRNFLRKTVSGSGSYAQTRSMVANSDSKPTNYCVIPLSGVRFKAF